MPYVAEGGPGLVWESLVSLFWGVFLDEIIRGWGESGGGNRKKSDTQKAELSTVLAVPRAFSVE